MLNKLSLPWIPIDRIESFLTLEPALMLIGVSALAFLFYKFFLKDASQSRHKLLTKQFKKLFVNILTFTFLFGIFFILRQYFEDHPTITRLGAYLGFFAILVEALAYARTCQVVANLMFFFRSPKAGVPVVLENFITMTFAIVLVGWIITDIFNIKIIPILATSAVFTLVLGLALQDTLGNLISGIALQLDKPYEIGDWIEIQSDKAIVGQVMEISWRATTLLSFTEEILTVPNRIMTQSNIANFSAKDRPFYRGHTFRLKYGEDIEKVKNILLTTVLNNVNVFKMPEPLAIVRESTESWISIRLAYAISDYGRQYIIGDEILNEILRKFEVEKIELASNIVNITSSK